VRVGAEFHAKGMIEEANAVFRRGLYTRLILAVGISALAYFMAPLLVKYPLSASDRQQLVWAGAAALAGISLILWGVDVAQSRRRFGTYFVLQFLAATVRALIVVVIVRKLMGNEPQTAQNAILIRAEPILWGIACASCIGGMLSIVLQRDVLKPGPAFNVGIEKLVEQKMWSFGRYAVATVVLGGVSAQVELLMLQSMLKADDTAIYDGARRLAMIFPLLATALTTVLLPRAAALDSAEACSRYARKAIKVTLPLAIAAGGAVAFGAPYFVPWLWGERYVASIPVLQWLCLAFAFFVVFSPLTLVLYPLQREGAVLILNALLLVISVAVGYVMIPRYGAMGAAWSAIIVRGVVMLLSGAVVVYSLKNPPSFSTSSPG
jgi:O-antigen/teichoic acid export membrane protein